MVYFPIQGKGPEVHHEPGVVIHEGGVVNHDGGIVNHDWGVVNHDGGVVNHDGSVGRGVVGNAEANFKKGK